MRFGYPVLIGIDIDFDNFTSPFTPYYLFRSHKLQITKSLHRNATISHPCAFMRNMTKRLLIPNE